MTTAPTPESALWERVRRSEADIAQLGERVTRIEGADKQDVIVERLTALNERVAELASQVKWLSRTLYTITALATLATAIITGLRV